MSNDESVKDKNITPNIASPEIKGIKNIYSKVESIFHDKSYLAK